MTQFLLLVKNFVEHTDSIYNIHPINEHDIKDALERCCKNLMENNMTISKLQNVNINVYDTYAEIVYTTETISKGWIYNSNVTTKQVAVLVQSVPVTEQTSAAHVSVACQTITPEESTVLYSHVPLFSVEDPNTNTHDYSDDLFGQKSNPIEISSIIKSPTLTPKLYTGYANTLLFPTWRDQFAIELKQKLVQPNRGLRPNGN